MVTSISQVDNEIPQLEMDIVNAFGVILLCRSITPLGAGAADGSMPGGVGPEPDEMSSLVSRGPGPLMAALGRRKRILILMSDTGGGHRASAEALAGALDELFPGAFLAFL